MKSIDDLLKDFREIVLYLPDKNKCEGFEVFTESYNEHKKINGSYAFLLDEDYFKCMCERQQYQLRKVREYVKRLNR